MAKYFKQTKFASFQRQLNLYGFSRITTSLDRGGYYHEMFLRGKRFLTHRISRMRVKGTKVRMASAPDHEPNFYAMIPLGPEEPMMQEQALPPPQMFHSTVRLSVAPQQEPKSQAMKTCHKDQRQLVSPNLALILDQASVATRYIRPNSSIVKCALQSCQAETISAPFPDRYPQTTDQTQSHMSQSLALLQSPFPPQPHSDSHTAHSQPRPPPQAEQEAAFVPCKGADDELDEVMFEGRVFHYLKPSKGLPRKQPSLTQYVESLNSSDVIVF